MTSRVFHLSGNQSEISCQIFPPLKIPEGSIIGLTHFQVYNSIPNIDKSNCNFKYLQDENWKNVDIPEGTYELEDIEKYLQDIIGESSLNITPNPNTLKCSFYCVHDVDFSTPNSIGQLFGMPKTVIKSKTLLLSKDLVKISNINSIQIEVNLVNGSYINGVPSNCVYKCFITTPPGFRIVECPTNVIYLPVNTDEIDSITVKLTDERNNLINFRGELISIELHLKI